MKRFLMSMQSCALSLSLSLSLCAVSVPGRRPSSASPSADVFWMSPCQFYFLKSENSQRNMLIDHARGFGAGRGRWGRRVNRNHGWARASGSRWVDSCQRQLSEEAAASDGWTRASGGGGGAQLRLATRASGSRWLDSCQRQLSEETASADGWGRGSRWQGHGAPSRQSAHARADS